MVPRRQSSTALDEAIGLLALPAQPGHAPLVRLELAWSRICGPLLARHCAPLSFDQGRLVIGVCGSDWREALFQQRRDLQQRVRQVVPGVREIRLQTVRVPFVRSAPERPPESRGGVPRVAPADPRTAEVADPALRAALDGLLAARSQRSQP